MQSLFGNYFAGTGQFIGWIDFFGREFLLFAGIWLIIGALDDLAVDLIWLGRKLTRRPDAAKAMLTRESGGLPGSPKLPADGSPDLAIFVPAWHEAAVIGDMLAHCLDRWPGHGYRLYVGCYGNDPATRQAIEAVAQGEPRIRVAVHERAGPTSKADCLNLLWRAMKADETRERLAFRAVVLHDAEDLVHPASLGIFRRLIGRVDFVQLPVIPMVDPASRWISGHYCDEFAEAHGKAMVVRGALAAGLPAAGVGCAFSTRILSRLARGDPHGPFAAESLTEDYELGLKIRQLGGVGLFVRERAMDGSWIATRSYFPGSLGAAVRQKARWMVGIALSGWDRMGWGGGMAEFWMRLRDRRAVLSALVLFAAYLAILCWGVSAAGQLLGLYRPPPLTPLLKLMLWTNFAVLLWRLAMRVSFTMHIYGLREALRAVPRLFVSNIIAIMAARRAMWAYVASLFGRPLGWDKTDHMIPGYGERSTLGVPNG